MANFYQNEIDDFRKRLLEEIEASRKQMNHGQCATISSNYDRQSYSPPPPPPQPKARTYYASSGSTFQHSVPPVHTCASYQEPRRLTDEEIYYRSVGEQNQKLLQEKQKLITTIQQLQNEVRRLREENGINKVKEEKKEVFKDNIVTVKKFFENLYNKTIEWFNT